MNTRKIDQIIVHCSATRAGVDFRASDIDRWHRERGFAQIGYHYVIDLDGTVENGRPLWAMGAHCLGWNLHSIGICYIGGLDEHCDPCDTRTDAQKKALVHLINYLCSIYRIEDVCGHYQVHDRVNKACPCFDARAEYIYLYKSVEP